MVHFYASHFSLYTNIVVAKRKEVKEKKNKKPNYYYTTIPSNYKEPEKEKGE